MTAPDPHLAALGQAIQQRREQLGHTAADLALAAGIPPKRLTALEAGHYDVPFDLLLALADALDMDAVTLVVRAEALTARALRSAFGQRVHELREQRGISQESLARRTGIHRTAVSKLDRGLCDPRMTTILRLADGLGVSPGALLDSLGTVSEDDPEQP